jgi:Flp pilus assembly protein TadD
LFIAQAKGGSTHEAYQHVQFLDDPHFDRALRLNPQLLRTRFNRGLALLQLGRRSEAKRDFDQYRRLGGKLTPAQEHFLRQAVDNGQ